MPVCEKTGCESEATQHIKFTDAIHTDEITDDPIHLCEEHANEARTLDGTDEAGLRKWLA